MHVFGESCGNRNLTYLFGTVCKVGLTGSIRELSIYEMSGFNEKSWYNYELLSWQLERTDWIILSVGLLMISNTEKQNLPENSNEIRLEESKREKKKVCVYVCVCVCESQGHLYMWVWFCIQQCMDTGVIAKGVFTKKDHADFLAKSQGCYCKFPSRFQCQPKLIFEPGIRAKALSLCHFVARSGIFFVNILLLHLTGFHIFCSPPLVHWTARQRN